MREKIIDQMAGPRRRASEQIRALGERRAETAQQRAALLQPDQRIVAVDLKMARQRRGVDASQARLIDAPGMVARRRRTAPAREHVEAGDGKSLRAREGEAGLAVAVAPGIAGPGVEQHAHRRQVDGDARAFERVCVDPRRKLAPAIDAADGKMPPAAVIGNLQVGIGVARDVGDIAGDGGEAAFIEREMRRTAVGHPAIDHAAALAHRGSVVERGKLRERSAPSGAP